jgi:LPXTG-site transpeptidase (sortase) family protein
MSQIDNQKTRSYPKTKDHRKSAMIFSFVGALLVLSAIGYQFSQKEQAPQSQQQQSANISEKLHMNASRPTRLVIGKLNIDAPFVELGLQSNGKIQVPEGGSEVGWYKYGPTPGEIGPSVVVGHLNTINGAAVFYDLNKLETGDKFEIEREDGKTAKFEVISKEVVPQDNFPTEKIYGPTNFAAIRLITCHGTYQRDKGHYSDDLVVYGKLIE